MRNLGRQTLLLAVVGLSMAVGCNSSTSNESEEKTAEEKTSEEKTAEEKTAEEKTAEEKTAEEKTAEEKVVPEGRAGDLVTQPGWIAYDSPMGYTVSLPAEPVHETIPEDNPRDFVMVEVGAALGLAVSVTTLSDVSPGEEMAALTRAKEATVTHTEATILSEDAEPLQGNPALRFKASMPDGSIYQSLLLFRGAQYIQLDAMYTLGDGREAAAADFFASFELKPIE